MDLLFLRALSISIILRFCKIAGVTSAEMSTKKKSPPRLTQLMTVAAVASPAPVTVPLDSRICFFAFEDNTSATIVLMGMIGVNEQIRLAIAKPDVFGVVGATGGEGVDKIGGMSLMMKPD